MRLTLESNAYCSGRMKGQERHALSKLADVDIEGWGAILLLIIGLLALWFFLAMGGIVALVGPLDDPRFGKSESGRRW